MGEFETQSIYKNVPASPGWAKMTYLNNLELNVSKRDKILGWLFATIMKQHGFAYKLADQGIINTRDEIFEELKITACNVLILVNQLNLGGYHIYLKNYQYL